MANTQLTDDELQKLLASSAPLNANGPSSLLPSLQAPPLPSTSALGLTDKTTGQPTYSADALLGKLTPTSTPGLGDAPRPTVSSQQELDIEGDEDRLRAEKAAPKAQQRGGLLGVIGYGRDANALYNKNRQDTIDSDTKNVLGERAGQSAEKKTDDDLFNHNLEAPVEDDLKKAQTRVANATADNAEAGKFTIEKTATGLVRVNAATGEAQPVTADGKPVGVPLETEFQSFVPQGAPANAKPHTYLVSKTDGSVVKDMGEHYEKPTNVNVKVPGSATMVITNPDGTHTLKVVNPGDNIPEGALTTNQYGASSEPTGTQKDASFRAKIGDGIRDKLLTELQDPAIRSQLGPLLGRAKTYEEFVGMLPANLAEFGQDLNSYAAFQAGLHPVRGIGALEYFDKKIGGLGQTPEQLEGKLKSGAGVAKDVERISKPGSSQVKTPTDTRTVPKVGEVVDGHKYLGGNPNDKNSWSK